MRFERLFPGALRGKNGGAKFTPAEAVTRLAALLEMTERSIENDPLGKAEDAQ
jgi:hypothetical protein